MKDKFNRSWAIVDKRTMLVVNITDDVDFARKSYPLKDYYYYYFNKNNTINKNIRYSDK